MSVDPSVPLHLCRPGCLDGGRDVAAGTAGVAAEEGRLMPVESSGGRSVTAGVVGEEGQR